MRFPVVGERQPSDVLAEPESWSMIMRGLVASEREIGLHELKELARSEVTFDIHCVTSWTRRHSTFTGIPLSGLLDPLPEARFVSFDAYSARGHHTSLPLDYAMEHSWVVHEFEGSPLTVEHGGPVRIVTPGKYFYKSIKWLKSVEALSEDRPGWWEVNSSYHNNADPQSGHERFTTGSLPPAQLSRFLESGSYDKYRGRVLIGLDLRSWRPASAKLTRLYLKNCNLRRVDLSGADLRASNLSLSDLTDADLTGADLSGSDLEGANFTGARLVDADLSGTALSATRFDGAVVAGTCFSGAWGLVESQQRYLEAEGAL